VYKGFLALGFEATKIGGNGKPDGTANAFLGYSDVEKNNNYLLTYDAKSTAKDKIQASTAKLSGIKRHQTDYHANFSVVVSVDYEGADNAESAICKEARQQKITVMRAKDLMRLLLLSAPHQISLLKLRELFETCYTPIEVTEWIDKIQNEKVKIGPIREVLEIIYDLQRNDTEPPAIATVRMKFNEKSKNGKISSPELKSLIESLRVFIPALISLEGDKVGIQGRPDKLMEVIHANIGEMDYGFRELYLSAFSSEKIK
jgi:hypothetical protein